LYHNFVAITTDLSFFVNYAYQYPRVRKFESRKWIIENEKMKIAVGNKALLSSNLTVPARNTAFEFLCLYSNKIRAKGT
jgi:hypothetical protein